MPWPVSAISLGFVAGSIFLPESVAYTQRVGHRARFNTFHNFRRVRHCFRRRAFRIGFQLFLSFSYAGLGLFFFHSKPR